MRQARARGGHLKRLPDRLLHRLRRVVARATVSRSRRVESVLVVCHGNICRSPFAEAALRLALNDESVRIASAGFVGPGRTPPANAVEAASAFGVDLSAHRSQLIDPEVARTADFVVVMDQRQARDVRERFGADPERVLLLGDFDPLPIDRRAILDPVEQPVAVFTSVYRRIDRCVAALAAAAGPSRRSHGAWPAGF